MNLKNRSLLLDNIVNYDLTPNSISFNQNTANKFNIISGNNSMNNSNINANQLNINSLYINNTNNLSMNKIFNNYDANNEDIKSTSNQRSSSQANSLSGNNKDEVSKKLECEVGISEGKCKTKTPGNELLNQGNNIIQHELYKEEKSSDQNIKNLIDKNHVKEIKGFENKNNYNSNNKADTNSNEKLNMKVQEDEINDNGSYNTNKNNQESSNISYEISQMLDFDNTQKLNVSMLNKKRRKFDIIHDNSLMIGLFYHGKK